MSPSFEEFLKLPDYERRLSFLKEAEFAQPADFSYAERQICRSLLERRYAHSEKEGEREEYMDRYLGFLLEQSFYLRLVGTSSERAQRLADKAFRFFVSEKNALLCAAAEALDLYPDMGEKAYRQALDSLRAPVEYAFVFELIHAGERCTESLQDEAEKERRREKWMKLAEVWAGAHLPDKNAFDMRLLLQNWGRRFGGRRLDEQV